MAEIPRPYGDILDTCCVKMAAFIIGNKNNSRCTGRPMLCNHIAHFSSPDEVAGHVETMHDELMGQ